MAADFGITSFGAYIPRLRLDRRLIADAHKWMAPGLKGQAKGFRAFCSWDEDAVTMAVEAARDCLGARARTKIDAIHLASTTLPYADLLNSALVASALGLPQNIRSNDFANSQRAGTSGLLEALKSGSSSLFIASDRPLARPASVQELTLGAGAAAFSLGTGRVIARLLGSGTVTAPFVDHFRAAGQRYDYHWEERWIRDEGYLTLAPQAISAALASAKLDIADVQHFVLAGTQRGAADGVAKKVKFAGKIAADLADGCGYAGTAHALLMLAATLEQASPGERILLVGFGQGADAVIFETTPALADARLKRGVAGSLADKLETDSYMRMLSFYDGIDLEWGMRSEKDAKTILTEQYRSSDQVASFVAGKCKACSAVQFPQLQFCVQCQAPASQFTQEPLTDERFKVMTYTADWLSYHPAPPLYVGFVQFDNGARLLMEMVDVGPAGIDVGTPLDAVFRIKERDKTRGYNRYFWKATPRASGS